MHFITLRHPRRPVLVALIVGMTDEGGTLLRPVDPALLGQRPQKMSREARPCEARPVDSPLRVVPANPRAEYTDHCPSWGNAVGDADEVVLPRALEAKIGRPVWPRDNWAWRGWCGEDRSWKRHRATRYKH